MNTRKLEIIPKSVMLHFKKHEATQKDLMLIHKIVHHNYIEVND